MDSGVKQLLGRSQEPANEADDTALESHGIPNIEAAVRQAQLQFNRWLRDQTTNKKAREFRLGIAGLPSIHRMRGG